VQVAPNHGIGINPILYYQYFKAGGDKSREAFSYPGIAFAKNTPYKEAILKIGIQRYVIDLP
jgi:hypothetical protein